MSGALELIGEQLVLDGLDIKEALAPFAELLLMMDEMVLVFDQAGSIVAANRAAAQRFGLLGSDAGFCLPVNGPDVRDVLYASDAARCLAPDLPFTIDGASCKALLNTFDGAFEQVLVKCRPISNTRYYLLVASIDLLGEAEREQTALLGEIRRLDERLQGILSVISCVSLGSTPFEEIASHIAEELQRVMQASAVIIYLADDYGFTPYGVSSGFSSIGIEKAYLPMGVGVPTLVARNRRTTRLQLISPPLSAEGGSIMLDVDSEMRFRLRSMLAECCSAIVATPVFSYDRIVAVVTVGWQGPHSTSESDIQLLDTVADYVSVEFAAAVTQIEQERSSKVVSAMGEIRESVREARAMTDELVGLIAQRVGEVVPSHVVVLEANPYTGSTIVRFGGDESSAIDIYEFPYTIDEIFPPQTTFVPIEASSNCGLWIARHTDLAQGYGVLLASDADRGRLAARALLVMRGSQDRPFDSVERGFLLKLGREVSDILSLEQERAHDAEIAKALQMGLRNVLPEVAGLTSSSLYISATETAVVGGDFFDMYALADDRVVVVMGDISGKGVESAAMASLVKTALAAYAWDYLDPAGMVSSLNSLLLNFSRIETFASMVVVSIDLRTGEATYCSAGHPPAMLVRRPGEPATELELLTVQSPVVGAFEGMHYENGMFLFGKGDILYLYTDGTTEARGTGGAFFGEDSLRETLLKACRRGAEKVPQTVLAGVEDFAGGNLHDDIAMVAVRYDGIERPTGSSGSAGSGSSACFSMADEDELGAILDGISFKGDS